MRYLVFLLGVASCVESIDSPTVLDEVANAANAAPCDNFQSPRDVGQLGEYSTSPTAGFSLGTPPNADSIAFTMPPDAYGRPGRTLTLTKCDEHYHDPIEHHGACLVPVKGEPLPPVVARTAATTDGPPAAGTFIELHTAYSERVNMAAMGLARCQGVAFVRASQWILSDDENSDALAFTTVSRYAGSTTGGGGERCKPPAWWEVLEHCHTMNRRDPRLAGHPHPARDTQTQLSPMRSLTFL